MRLVFDAPEGHSLIVDGDEVTAGEPFDVSAKRGKDLLKDPNVSVREIKEPKKPEADGAGPNSKKEN